MNQPTSVSPLPPTDSPGAALQARLEPLLRQPWMLVALVLAVALMSSYVHVLNGQVERGERFRQSLAQASHTGAMVTATRLLADASQQPLATVSLDTRR